MGSSARPIDNEPQKCYNIDVLSDVVYKRITEKANYPKKQKVKVEILFRKRKNVPTEVIYR
jgi:hypothetical protein